MVSAMSWIRSRMSSMREMSRLIWSRSNGLARHVVGGALDGLDPEDPLVAPALVAVSGQHVHEGLAALHDQAGVTVEQGEEMPLARHQHGQQLHAGGPRLVGLWGHCGACRGERVPRGFRSGLPLR